MQSKANRFSELGSPAQGSAIGSDETIGSRANVIYPLAFSERVSANVADPASQKIAWHTAGATGVFALAGSSQFTASADTAGIIGNAYEGDIMSDPTREEIKEAIAASEARGETKIARFEGKLDLVLSKLDDVRQDNRSTRANQWVIGFGLAVLMVSIAALFPVFFSIGGQLRDMVHAEVHDQLPVPSVPPTSRPPSTQH